VQTLDFFAPTVDDPYQYGAIAAANALNDIYAMGADVLFALNIAAFPEDLPIEMVAAVLEGGADKVREAGGAVAGGHTIIDREPKYGLCVTGLVHPDMIRSNSGATAGDVVVLTKPLGTGVLVNAMRGGHVSDAHEAFAIAQMSGLNKAAADVCRDFTVHALTDVTGFGIAGHMVEVSTNSAMGVEVSLGALPPMPGLTEYVNLDIDTAGQTRNREYFSTQLSVGQELTRLQDTLLYDPQTAGGMLIVLPAAEAAELGERLEAAGGSHWEVGAVVDGAGVRVVD